jgi:hypothetical protein
VLKLIFYELRIVLKLTTSSLTSSRETPRIARDKIPRVER